MLAAESKLVAVKCRCKSQFCKDCAMSHCVMWRERLREHLGHWKSCIMFTLSLDRTGNLPKSAIADSILNGKALPYCCPESGLEFVQRRRSIPKLIAKLEKSGALKSREYTVTLEFHKSGWPHWHVLVDSKFVCKHELQRAWKLGVCWFSKPKGFESTEHAINYATKYVVKTTDPDDDDDNREEFVFPEWVMDKKTNLRRFSASRELSKRWSRGGRRVLSDDKPTKVRITKTGREKIET